MLPLLEAELAKITPAKPIGTMETIPIIVEDPVGRVEAIEVVTRRDPADIEDRVPMVTIGRQTAADVLHRMNLTLLEEVLDRRQTKDELTMVEDSLVTVLWPKWLDVLPVIGRVRWYSKILSSRRNCMRHLVMQRLPIFCFTTKRINPICELLND
jgi:hypothetical protein